MWLGRITTLLPHFAGILAVTLYAVLIAFGGVSGGMATLLWHGVEMPRS